MIEACEQAPEGDENAAAATLDGLDRLTQEFVDRHPETCACVPVSRRQKAFYAGVVVFWLGLLFYRWDLWVLAITVFMSLWYLAAVLFRALSVMASLLGRGVVNVSQAALSSLDDEQLPYYTILVPLYHESNIAGKIVTSLKRLDYPQEKLDVKLLLEADDEDTQTAVAACDLPPEYEVIVVPDGHPRTKPRACNYGLERAKGEYCVIYDAEDRPDADQLRKAVWAFRDTDDNLVCLQASLNYFNRKQNLLTRWFTVEYSTTFDLLLPGLQTLGVPVPLGGTSNHFRTDALRRVGGWDPFNVTEDCDLGVRLYTCGYRTSMLKSTTWEEANSRPWNWVRQRSRWVKGFMQTHLTYMRHPLLTWRKLGTRGLIGFYLAVGASSFMMVTNVVYWLLAGLYLGLLGHGLAHGRQVWGMVCGPHVPSAYAGVSILGGDLKAWPLLYQGADQSAAWSTVSVVLFTMSMVLLSANLFFVLVHVMACIKRRYFDLLPAALAMPLYWVLISIGAWKGFIQLFTRPFYWEKTIHGLDVDDDDQPAVADSAPAWQERAVRSGTSVVLAVLSLGLATCVRGAQTRDPGASGVWLARADDGLETRLALDDEGVVRGYVPADGGQVLRRAQATTFRAWRGAFEAAALELDVRSGATTQARLFIQTADGLWFQSRRTTALPAGEWVTLKALLSAAESDMEPRGHRGAWHALEAVEARTIGVKLEHPGAGGKVSLACRAPRWTGRRSASALDVYAWELPAAAAQYHRMESRFLLTREYFNPFDPDEVQVDVEIRLPDGGLLRRPAFFSQEHARELHGTEEVVLPARAPFWAFRFTPTTPGVHAGRLIVQERRGAAASGGAGTTKPGDSVLETGWREFRVAPSAARGFVQVSERDSRYFEFSNGEFFFPIGLNLHTIQDLRGDRVVEGPPTIDRGTYTFDEYFDSLAAHDANLAEIWMAAWSLGLEWSRAKPGFRGLGRYHLGNAWRLDHVLERARERGIYVHLVLDNHGKLSDFSDPEWAESPLNRASPYAVADGAVLDFPDAFYRSDPAWRYYARRNRYIAARWGEEPSVMGIEFWSEFNLTTAFERMYARGDVEAWSQRAARHLREFDRHHILTTHFCGDYKNNLRFSRLAELPEIQYVVSDAYRGGDTPMTDQMWTHARKLQHFGKPLLITEYGGNWDGTSHAQLEADLHTGIWGSFFTKQAGTPLLWWHAFVHRTNRYGHYRGLARYMADIDPIGKAFRHRKMYLRDESGQVCSRYVVLTAGIPSELYGWIGRRSELLKFRDDDARRSSCHAGHHLQLDGLHEQTYCLEWWDPLSGEVRERHEHAIPASGVLKMSVPKIGRDLAFKLRPVKEGGAQ